MTKKQNSVLIIEPQKQLIAPYLHLPKTYRITRTSSLQTGFEHLLDSPPDLVLTSVHFSRRDLFDFLTELKAISRYKLIPLIFVVNLAKPFIYIPGTHWGGSLGLLHTLSSQKEVAATLQRILAKT